MFKQFGSEYGGATFALARKRLCTALETGNLALALRVRRELAGTLAPQALYAWADEVVEVLR